MKAVFLIPAFVILTLGVLSVNSSSDGFNSEEMLSQNSNLTYGEEITDSKPIWSNSNELKMRAFLSDNYHFLHEYCLLYSGIIPVQNDITARMLQQACYSGDIKAVMEIHRENVDLSMHDNMAIKTAADMNHSKLVKGLLLHGCNGADIIKYILNAAVKNGNHEFVSFVSNHELCVQEFKDRALGEAVRYGHLNVVRTLLDSGANYSIYGGYLVKLAQINEFSEIETFLNEIEPVSEIEDYQVLRWGASLGHLEMVMNFIRGEEDLNNALDYACGNGHLEVIEYLLKSGADIHNSDGSPLRSASREGQLSVVQYLVSRGADVNAGIVTALEKASSCGHLEIVQYLIAHGANIGHEQAIESARDRGHEEIVSFLQSLSIAN